MKDEAAWMSDKHNPDAVQNFLTKEDFRAGRWSPERMEEVEMRNRASVRPRATRLGQPPPPPIKEEKALFEGSSPATGRRLPRLPT